MSSLQYTIFLVEIASLNNFALYISILPNNGFASSDDEVSFKDIFNFHFSLVSDWIELEQQLIYCGLIKSDT